MGKFYEKIVNNPKKITVTFLVIFLISLVLKSFVSVNYDMNDYLPEDSLSTLSLEIMEEEFEGGIPNARVMIKDLTVPEALEYKEKIKGIEGVKELVWLDDAVDLSIPLETIDSNIVESYYKDNTALFTVTVEESKRIEAINSIRDLIGDDNAMTGSAVSTAMATESTLAEISKISSIAVLFVLIVLIFTTTSWIEPVIILIGLGVAITINAGSNLIFGEISFVSNAAGNILQLAVSLDYSIFLIHRFKECRKETSDVKEAMVMALTKSTSSIIASGLTTVIGFLALVLMEFRIGSDLGLVLAKGIVISLIAVFVFVPSLILLTYKLLDKTEHRAFLPSFEAFGRFVTKVMIPMVCIFVIVIVPSYLASNSNSFYYGASRIFDETTKLGQDTREIESVYGKRDTYVLLLPKGDTAREKKLSSQLKGISQVSAIISYVDSAGAEIPSAYVEDKLLSKLESDKYRRMIISVDADFEGEETVGLIREVKEIAQEYYPDTYYLAGEGISTYDLMNTITKDMVKVNMIAIVAVFIVLLLSMKSISIPLILVLAIETAIWINLSIPYFKDSVIFYIAYLIISSIQLGATVDYAILFTDRYKEYRVKMKKEEAIIKTISSITPSILTSGSVLTMVGFLLGYISSHGLLSQLGFFLGRGTLCSMIIVFFVLPGLLYIFDGIIGRTTKNSNFMK